MASLMSFSPGSTPGQPEFAPPGRGSGGPAESFGGAAAWPEPAPPGLEPRGRGGFHMGRTRVALQDMPGSHRDRVYDFLMKNSVDFNSDQTGRQFWATIRVEPTPSISGKISGTVHQVVQRHKQRKADDVPTSYQAKKAMKRLKEKNATYHIANELLSHHFEKLCSLMPPFSELPRPVRKCQLHHFIDEVYEHRYNKDSAAIKHALKGEVDTTPQCFPVFVYQHTKTIFGMKRLVRRHIWGIMCLIELERSNDKGIDLFGKFLGEMYDTADLLFCLTVRKFIYNVLHEHGHMAHSDKHVKESPISPEELKRQSEILVSPRQQTKQDRDYGEPDLKHVKSKLMTMTANHKRRRELSEQQIRKIEDELVANACAGTLHEKQHLLSWNTVDAKQCVDIVRSAVKEKGGLRDAILQKLDEEMLERHGNDLPVDVVLSVMTQEYHNSRVWITDRDVEIIMPSSFVPEAWMMNLTEEDLEKDIRNEVGTMTQTVLRKLQEHGHLDVDTRRVFLWALGLTVKKHGLKPSDVRQKAAAGESETEESKTVVADATANVPESEIFSQTPEEFETNLETNVRQLMHHAMVALVEGVVGQVLGTSWGAEAKTVLESTLLIQYTPIADKLMEAIVSDDFDGWVNALEISQPAAPEVRNKYNGVLQEFQNMLTSSITAVAVRQICRSVASVDQLVQLVEARAAELVTLDHHAIVTREAVVSPSEETHAEPSPRMHARPLTNRSEGATSTPQSSMSPRHPISSRNQSPRSDSQPAASWLISPTSSSAQLPLPHE